MIHVYVCIVRTLGYVYVMPINVNVTVTLSACAKLPGGTVTLAYIAGRCNVTYSVKRIHIFRLTKLADLNVLESVEDFLC
jgi:hypothetical protein